MAHHVHRPAQLGASVLISGIWYKAVIASQHTAGVTLQSRANITRIAALAFSNLAAGRMPPRVINPAVLPRWRARYEAAMGQPVG